MIIGIGRYEKTVIVRPLFETYTFWIGDVQRCFTVFRPPSRASESLPVSLFSNCYAQDHLDGIFMVEPNSPFNKGSVALLLHNTLK